MATYSPLKFRHIALVFPCVFETRTVTFARIHHLPTFFAGGAEHARNEYKAQISLQWCETPNPVVSEMSMIM